MHKFHSGLGSRALGIILIVCLTSSFPATWAQSVHDKYQAAISKKDAGRCQEAINDFTDIITIRPYYYEAWLERGMCRLAGGDAEGARGDIEEAIRLNPEYYLSYYYRGLWNSSAGTPRQAVTDFKKTISLNPKYGNAFYQLSLISLKQGNPEQALTEINQAFSLNPSNTPEAWLLSRSEIYAALKKPKEAIDDLSKAISSSKKPAALYYRRALLYRQVNNDEAAVKDLTAAENGGMKNRDITATKASIYESNGRYTEAIPEYTMLIETWKESTSGSHYYKRAICYDSLDQREAAIKDYSKAMIYDRENIQAILARAAVYLRDKKLVQAQADYRRITRNNPDNAEAWKGLGKISLQQNKLQLAFDELSNAITNGGDAEAYFLRAECLFSLNKESEALRDLEQAAKMGHEGARKLLDNQRR